MNRPTATTQRQGWRGRNRPNNMHADSTRSAVNNKSLMATSAHPVPMPASAASRKTGASRPAPRAEARLVSGFAAGVGIDLPIPQSASKKATRQQESKNQQSKNSNPQYL